MEFEESWARLKTLPVYLHRKGMKPIEKIQLSDPRAKTVTSEAYNRLQKMVKLFPDTTKEIESHPNLEEVIFTSEPQRGKSSLIKAFVGEAPRRLGQIGGAEAKTEYDPKEGLEFVYLPTYKELMKGAHTPIHTLLHEGQHIEQLRKWGGAKSKLSRKMFKGRYEMQKGEIEAEKVAQKKLKEALGDIAKTGKLEKRRTWE
jgi:hypothetical protein